MSDAVYQQRRAKGGGGGGPVPAFATGSEAWRAIRAEEDPFRD